MYNHSAFLRMFQGKNRDGANLPSVYKGTINRNISSRIAVAGDNRFLDSEQLSSCLVDIFLAEQHIQYEQQDDHGRGCT